MADNHQTSSDNVWRTLRPPCLAETFPFQACSPPPLLVTNVKEPKPLLKTPSWVAAHLYAIVVWFPRLLHNKQYIIYYYMTIHQYSFHIARSNCSEHHFSVLHIPLIRTSAQSGAMRNIFDKNNTQLIMEITTERNVRNVIFFRVWIIIFADKFIYLEPWKIISQILSWHRDVHDLQIARSNNVWHSKTFLGSWIVTRLHQFRFR